MENYSEEKENFFKKILENKWGLCLFFITFSVIINMFGFKLLPRLLVWIMNSVFGLKNAISIWIVYLVLYVLTAIIGLVLLHKIKNKRYSKKADFRFILDLIFIIEVFILFSYMINLSYLVLDLIKIYVSIDSEFWLFILSSYTIFYILNSLIKNIAKISYVYLILLILLWFLSGTIGISKFMVVTLLVTIVNIFFSDIIFLYKNSFRNINKNNYLNNNSIIENRTKEKNCSRKLLFNIGIFILYIYLCIIENDRLGVLQFLVNILNIPVFNVETLPTSAVLDCFGTIIKDNKFLMFFYDIAELIYIGILRMILLGIILFVLLILLAFILLIKSVYRKTPFKTELDRFYKKIEYFPMNFVKKFVHTKKITIPKTKRRNGKIKTTMYRTSRNNYRRGRKFKKPNSN